MFGSGDKETKVSMKGDQLNGLLDKGCSFVGKLTFDGTVQINGDFEGEIYSDGTLVIGNDARVKAKVFVDSLSVHGKMEGDIEAKSRIEMHVPAVVVANVNTKTLSVEDGVIFEGRCHMERSGLAEADAEDDRKASEAREGEEDVLVM